MYLDGDRKMAEACLSKDEILKSTLFHIQLKQCQYIDDFPEKVSFIIEKTMDENGLLPYDKIKRRLYRIDTSFWEINKDKIKKRDFYLGLYERLERKVT